MTIGQFFRILRARWLIVGAIFALTVLGTAALNELMPRQYLAMASVLVDMKPDPIAGAVNPELLSTAYIATQVDILNSGRVAQRAAKQLGLDEAVNIQTEWKRATGGRGDLVAWIATGLQKKIRVSPDSASNVITIFAKGSDPKSAAELANAYVQAYLDTTVELKVDPAKQNADWFDQRAQELRADLMAKQQRLSDFQKANDITGNDERLDIENARLSELSSQLTSIQLQRQDSQSRQRQVELGDKTALPEVLQSSVIAGLKAELAREEAKLNNVSTNLGQNHPDYLATKAEVDSLRQRISDEEAKVATSLGNVVQSNLRREHDIRSALDAQKLRVLDLKHQRDVLSDLQNEVAAAQRNLDTVTQRLGQSSLESQARQSNVVELTAASEPVFPSSPNIRLNLALGLLLGAILGIGVGLLWEAADPRIRAQNEVTLTASVPLLGKVRSSRRRIRSASRRLPALPSPQAAEK